MATRRHALALAAGSCVSGLSSPPVWAADQPALTDLQFEIFMGDERIGTHQVAFQGDNSDFVERTQLRIKVTRLLITAFRFEQDVTAHWQNGQMVTLETDTLRNRKQSKVKAWREGDRLKIVGDKNESVAPLGVMTDVSWWHPAIIDQERVVDTDKGSLQQIDVVDSAGDKVTVMDQQIRAERHRILADDRTVSLWFAPELGWVRGQLVLPKATLDFVRTT
ncbi:MAG: DUF6134 family protein [Geminicoccaceae bacterium]